MYIIHSKVYHTYTGGLWVQHQGGWVGGWMGRNEMWNEMGGWCTNIHRLWMSSVVERVVCVCTSYTHTATKRLPRKLKRHPHPGHHWCTSHAAGRPSIGSPLPEGCHHPSSPGGRRGRKPPYGGEVVRGSLGEEWSIAGYAHEASGA